MQPKLIWLKLRVVVQRIDAHILERLGFYVTSHFDTIVSTATPRARRGGASAHLLRRTSLLFSSPQCFEAVRPVPRVHLLDGWCIVKCFFIAKGSAYRRLSVRITLRDDKTDLDPISLTGVCTPGHPALTGYQRTSIRCNWRNSCWSRPFRCHLCKPRFGRSRQDLVLQKVLDEAEQSRHPV